MPPGGRSWRIEKRCAVFKCMVQKQIYFAPSSSDSRLRFSFLATLGLLGLAVQCAVWREWWVRGGGQ